MHTSEQADTVSHSSSQSTNGATNGPKNGSKKELSSADPSVRPLIDLILSSLDDDKAEEIVAIDLQGKTSIADFMVVANGRSNRQVVAIAEHLAQRLKDEGYGTCHVEGLPQGDWVLIDAGDVIVHLFRPEVRAFYNLEKMWSVNLNGDQPENRIDDQAAN